MGEKTDAERGNDNAPPSQSPEGDRVSSEKPGKDEEGILKRLKEEGAQILIEQWGKLKATVIPGKKKTQTRKLTSEQLEILGLIESLDQEERKKIIALIRSKIKKE